MRISGVATAFPKYCFTQREVAEALKSQWDDKVPNPGILSRMMYRVGVDRRHFVLPLDGYLPMDTWARLIMSGSVPPGTWRSRPCSRRLSRRG